MNNNHNRLTTLYSCLVTFLALVALAGCTASSSSDSAQGGAIETSVAVLTPISPIQTPMILTTSSPTASEEASNDAIAEDEGTSANIVSPIATPLALPSTVAPESVEIAPDTPVTERGGLLPSGPGMQQYVLAATEGQTVTVDVKSDGTPLALTIESPSGNRWIPEMMPATEGYTIGQQFVVPETGDYLVTLGKTDHSPSTNFEVTFTVQ